MCHACTPTRSQELAAPRPHRCPEVGRELLGVLVLQDELGYGSFPQGPACPHRPHAALLLHQLAVHQGHQLPLHWPTEHARTQSRHTCRKVMRTFTLVISHLLCLNVTAFNTLTKKKDFIPRPKEQRNGRPKFVRTSYVGGGLITEVLSLDHVSNGSFFLRNQKWFRVNCTRMTKAYTKSSNRIGWTNNHQTTKQSCGQVQEKIILPVSNFLQHHKSTAAFRRH